jgi:hypothetical protein
MIQTSEQRRRQEEEEAFSSLPRPYTSLCVNRYSTHPMHALYTDTCCCEQEEGEGDGPKVPLGR